MSSLNFVSKDMEKVAAMSLYMHMDIRDLMKTFQSAYKELHRTETDLVRVHNDIPMAVDGKQSVCLVLLNLLAAFDTLDHQHLTSFFL